MAAKKSDYPKAITTFLGEDCTQAKVSANKILSAECSRKVHPIASQIPCQEGCEPINIPEILPCLSLRWGDGRRDQIETDDVEVLCIIASNPYANVTLKNLTIVLTALTLDGNPVPALPDGTPSVEITPSEFICFGDLTPCPEDGASASREVVLVSRGARAGNYIFSVGYCFSVELMQRQVNRFRLELVSS